MKGIYILKPNINRCFGSGENHCILTYYHDFEWGVPVYDDRLLFEMLSL